MFEHHTDPLAPIPVFVWRLTACVGIGLLLVLFSLAVGMAGYHWIEGLPWIDAFLSASMILSGMGPLGGTERTSAAKLFEGCYALYSGFILLAIAGVILSPVVHRAFHRFHIEVQD